MAGKELVELAKNAVKVYLKEGKKILPPEEFPEEFLKKKAGVFVSLHKVKNGQEVLRGCIGTYLPTKENIALETIENAILAATEDPRFEPLKIEELPEIIFTVYILSSPHLVKEIKELDPKKFGIIVKSLPIKYKAVRGKEVIFDGLSPEKTGILLPDLEGIDTIEGQILIACQKANIDPFSEDFLIYKFEVQKFTEK
jgi:uncharacterized protein (TIGR00296 family)